MNRVARITGTIVGSVAAIVVCAALALYIAGRSRAGDGGDISVGIASRPADSASIARGEHLVNAVAACAACHNAGLKGRMFDTPPALVSMAAPNLTPGGATANYAAKDWDRAIRHGLGRDGRRLIIMPSESYAALSDSDFTAVAAYLRTLPAAPDTFPARRIGPVGGVLLGLGALPLAARTIVHDKVGSNHPVAGATAEYGSYLATIGSCASCHGVDLNGKKAEHGAPAGPSLLALTSSWSESEFRELLRTGKDKTGRPLAEAMPWRIYGKMTDEELAAIWQYLSQQSKQQLVRKA